MTSDPHSAAIPVPGTAGEHNKRMLIDEGYCVIRQVVPITLIERLTWVTTGLAQEQEATNPGRFQSQGSMIGAMAHPLLAELISLPSAAESVAALGYPSPTFTDGYIISKPPGCPRLFWHYDWFSWCDPSAWEPEPQQLFLMYYLTDTSVTNGCLRVIPGSHLSHNPLHEQLASPHSRQLAEVADERGEAFSDRPDEVDVPVRAGDLVIGDARLLHAAHANESAERRTVITLWLQPDFEVLPERIKAQVVRKTHPVPAWWPSRARTRVEALHPAWNGTAEPYERTLYIRRPERVSSDET
jgi:hypothetical protein